MRWPDALEAMRKGAQVRRAAHRPDLTAAPILLEGGTVVRDAGTEPCMLMAAWADDDRPVMVFVGAWSKSPFVPSAEDVEASDWCVE